MTKPNKISFKKSKRQLSNCEKIFATYTTDKGLTSLYINNA